jgi:hypothetical protein
LAAAALGAAVTATAGASIFTDDTAVQFAAGTPGGTTAVIEPGSVRLRPATEEFDGIGLPANLTAAQWSPPYGTANAGGGTLAIDGTRVQDTGTYPVGEVLEVGATFSGALAQHIGFGVTLDDGPWAIISTGSGGGVGASTRAAPGATATFDPIAVPVPNGENTFRIEWSPTEVRLPRATEHQRSAPHAEPAAHRPRLRHRSQRADRRARGGARARPERHREVRQQGPRHGRLPLQPRRRRVCVVQQPTAPHGAAPGSAQDLRASD